MLNTVGVHYHHTTTALVILPFIDIHIWILVLFNMVYISEFHSCVGIVLYSCDPEFQPELTGMLLALLLPCCTLSFGFLEADST